jgi:hypothetical protein
MRKNIRPRSSHGVVHVAVVGALLLLAVLVIFWFYYRPTIEWEWKPLAFSLERTGEDRSR